MSNPTLFLHTLGFFSLVHRPLKTNAHFIASWNCGLTFLVILNLENSLQRRWSLSDPCFSYHNLPCLCTLRNLEPISSLTCIHIFLHRGDDGRVMSCFWRAECITLQNHFEKMLYRKLSIGGRWFC